MVSSPDYPDEVGAMSNQATQQQTADPGVVDESLTEDSLTSLDVFELPPWALLRVNDIVGKKISKKKGKKKGKKNQTRGARLIPVSQSAWWEGVRTGKYPPGKKVGSIRVWTVAEIKDLAEQLVGS